MLTGTSPPNGLSGDRMDERSPRRYGMPRAALLFLAAVGVAEQLRILRITETNTNEDQTLFWYMAREVGRFRIRGPNPYGQSYGSTLEAWLVELLRLIGVRLSTATVLALIALYLAGWYSLMVAAWKRSHPLLAAAAAAAPILLSAYHTVYVTTVLTYPAARCMAVAGGACLMLPRPSDRVAAVAWSLLGLAALMDPSTTLFSAPVAVWHLVSRPFTRQGLRPLAIGAVLPVAWLTWWWSFQRQHPDYGLHGGVSYRPRWSQLSTINRTLELYRPELIQWWWVPLACLAIFVVILLSTRRRMYVVPTLGVVVLLLGGMASPKAGEDAGDFLPPGRVLLAFPYVLWFLAFLACESGVLQPARRQVPVLVRWIALMALVCASVGIRAADFDHRVVNLRDSQRAAAFGQYGFLKTDAVLDECRQVSVAAHKANTSLVVFPQEIDRSLAYGCGALAYGELDTLLLAYERRTWRLYEELDRDRSAAVFWNAPSNFCRAASRRVSTCEQGESGTVVLRFVPQSIHVLLASLGMPTRAFGPRCELRTDGVSGVGCSEPLRLSLADMTVGPAPSDPQEARRAIERAFAVTFAGEAQSAPLALVEDGELRSRELTAEERQTLRSITSGRAKGISFLDVHEAILVADVELTNGKSCALSGRAIIVRGRWTVALPTFNSILYLAGAGCGT